VSASTIPRWIEDVSSVPRVGRAALETEVAAYLQAHRDERDGDGHALVVRNGKGRTRNVTVGSL
jgi:hypothetical protein